MQIDNTDIHAIRYQPVMFSPGQGPNIPMIPDIPPHIQPFVPLIAGVMVNTITQGATGQNTHAGRILLYNQMYKENFLNPTFIMAVAMASDYILFAISRNETSQNNIAEGVQLAVNRSLGLMSAYNIQRLPELHKFLAGDIVQEGLMLAQNAQQMLAIVNSIKAQLMQPQQGYQPAVQTYPQYQQPMQYQHTPVQNTQGMSYATSTSGGNPAFQMPGNHQGTPMHTPALPDNGRYSHMSRQAAAAVQQNPSYSQQIIQPVVQQVVVQTADPETEDWVCNPVQPHPTAYYADSEMLVARHAINPLNQTKCIIVQITPIQQPSEVGSSIMDRSRHQLSAGYQSQSPDQVNLTGEALAARSGEILAAESKVVLMRADFYEEPVDAGTGGIVLTVDEALLKTQHRLMVVNAGKTKDKALTASFLLAKPIITRGIYREALEALTSSVTLDALGAMMRQLSSNSKHSEQNHLIKQLDLYVTDEFNRFMRDKLSLTITLDSFMNDQPELLEYVNNNKGSIYGDAITENQSEFLKKIFTPMDQSVYDSVIYTLIDPNYISNTEPTESTSPYTSAVFQFVTVTAVGFTGEQLNVGLLDKHSGVLSSERFPGLLSYAKNILKTSSTNSEHPVAHHYIVTTDLQVYEIHQGLIGLGTYLISKVK